MERGCFPGAARLRSVCAVMARGLAAGLAITLAACPAQAEEVPPDQRQPPRMAPLDDAVAEAFLPVGRINRAGFRVLRGCTGTLIRPDVVLTAAHCVTGSEETWVFVTGWRRGDYHAVADLAGGVKHPAYGVGGGHDPRFDLGLVFLAAPMEGVTPLPLAGAGAALPEEAALVGYHNLTPHLMTGRLDCPLLQTTERLAAFDCPVVGGNSGGPVLIEGPDGGWQVAAVVSSQFRRSGQPPGALAVTALDWVRSELAQRDKAGE